LQQAVTTESETRRQMANQRIKMKDVAVAAGVSTMTVSRALQRDARIAPATRQHILSVIETMGYVPDQIAASFSSQRSRFVAALVPSLNNPHFAESIRGLSETLETEGIQVLLGQTNYKMEREERLVSELLRRRPEAIVITADAHSTKTRSILKAAGIPVIEIWDTPPEPIGHRVGFSNHEATKTMVHYLAGCGYRRIAYVGETHDIGTRGARRREGYVAALAELGLGAPRIHLQCPPPVSMTEGRSAFHTVRETWPDTDAIMCVSDPCAFGVMMEAIASGVSVPNDISIAGFGDFEIGRCCVPSLTTVGVNAFQLGFEAGQLLKGERSKTPDKPQDVSIPYGVIGRNSTLDRRGS
jgi:LacI family transcriptional regulator, gluconate utilization system Gnt-I transcriptional repressor